ncbi:MAG TPA: CHASE2 domain-containing protein [Pseudoxanthomonas sp.]|nr:CHASE2 domain-containing protein [Pseudoxanthomonas sp.]
MSATLPARSLQPLHRALVGMAALALVAVLTLSGLFWRADTWVYDLLLDLRGQKADERIVVVAIDQKSLAELGRWPWSRRLHAQLLDRLAAAGARSVAFDILLTEPVLHDPEGDAVLAQSMSRYGRAVLPVFAEPAEVNAPATEALPIPELAAAAAGLGHVDLPMDADGVARSMFLQAGMGDPHWPSLALAQFQLDQSPTATDKSLPGLRSSQPNASPYLWSRDYKVLVPYANSPDGFTEVSYADVLHGRVPAAALRDRWILVGVTASGLGDTLNSPGDLADSRLSGVEYQANALNALAHGNLIVPLPLPLQLALSAAVIVLPLLLYGLPGLRNRGLLVLGASVLAILLSIALLCLGNRWFSPMPVLLVLLLSGIALGVQLLRRTHARAMSDALTGLANRAHFDGTLEQEIRVARRTGQPLSLLLVDVDRFKQLNDTLGHPAGDELLVRLAKVLKARARRPRDLVSRLGGDEFAVLLPETSAHSAASIASTIHADIGSLATPAMIAAGQTTSVSIGVHSFPSDHDVDGEDVMGLADAALYRAKQNGRNRTATSVELTG